MFDENKGVLILFSVIFDMDGTLLDTQKICIDAWNVAGENQGFKNMGSEIPNVCGMNKAGWTRYLNEHYPTLDADRFNSEMRQYVVDNQVVSFKKGGKELLDFLKDNNIKIGLASGSSHETIDHHLAEVHATDYFCALTGGSDVKHGKPAPDIFLYAAEKMGVAAQDCFVFEDSSNGALAAYAAGMKCIGIPDVAPFTSKAQAVLFKELDSMDEAIEILKEYL